MIVRIYIKDIFPCLLRSVIGKGLIINLRKREEKVSGNQINMKKTNRAGK